MELSKLVNGKLHSPSLRTGFVFFLGVSIAFLTACTGFESLRSSDAAPVENQDPGPPTPTTKTFTIRQKLVEPYNGPDQTVTTPVDTDSTTNLLITVVRQGTDNGTLTDNKGNTFTFVGKIDATNALGAYDDETYVYYAIGATGGTGHTFTFASVLGFATVFVTEFKADAAIQFGQSVIVGTPQTGTRLDMGSITTTADSSLLFAFSALGETPLTLVYSWLNSFTSLLEMADPSYWQGSVAWKTVSAGTHNVAVDANQVTDGVGIILEFK